MITGEDFINAISMCFIFLLSVTQIQEGVFTHTIRCYRYFLDVTLGTESLIFLTPL